MAGRKPKPSYMRVLDGNAGHRPINKEEPQPEGALDQLAPPDRLSEEQRAIWIETIARSPPGLLRELDWGIFEQWVVHCSFFREAAKKVATLGLLLKHESGAPYHNPYLAVMNKQSAQMKAAAAELGFTPSSRTRVKVQTKKPTKGNPFSDLKQLAADDS